MLSCVPARRDHPSEPYLAVEEAFDEGSDQFVPLLRGCRRDPWLAALANRWLKDPRPWARRAMLAYLDEPFDVPGHNALVKRLFKAAEARGDIECMARFMARFDESLRSEVLQRSRWDYGDRRPVFEEYLGFADDALYPQTCPPPPPGSRAMGSRVSMHIAPRAGRLFSPQTRRYMRRRAWRFFRQLGFRDPAAYRAGICLALQQYPADAVRTGPDLLQSWSLCHALFRDSELLERTREQIRVRPERHVRNLEPAPAFAEVWTGADATEPLLDVLVGARCGVVLTWARKQLDTHHAGTLANLPLRRLKELLTSDSAAARDIGIELLRTSQRCGTWTVEQWLDLLAIEDTAALAAIAAQFGQHVHADRVEHDVVIRLLTDPSAAVVDQALALAHHKDWSDHRERLVELADATCAVRAPEVTRFALGHLELAGERYDRDRLLPFFDSLQAEIRDEAWEWLEAHPRAQNDTVLWTRLFETPYSTLRHRLVPALERLAAASADAGAPLTMLWTSVLLDVQRGSRNKGRALRQLIETLVETPDSAETLLPVVALAVRSIRGPESEAGLHAVLTAFARQPELRGAITAALPELELPEEPPCW